MGDDVQTVTAEFSFEAAHALDCVPAGHKCARLHGHGYVVTLDVEGEGDWIVDYAEIARAFDECVHSVLDHRRLDDVPGLRPSTSERLTLWIRDALLPVLPGLCFVRVQETAKFGATWRAWR